MPITYKQKCKRCNKNYVMVSRRDRYIVCHECRKKELEGEIKDPEIKKLFDIPEEYYKQNNFLRNIKVSYLKYGGLTEKQIAAFKKVVKQIQDKEKEKK